MMGSEITGIPLIEFSQLQGCSDKNILKIKVTEALVEYGCFEAIFPGVTEENMRSLFDCTQQLLELPLETKQKCPPCKSVPGYIINSKTGYQSIGFDDPHVLQTVEAVVNTLWPNANPKLSETVQSYSERSKVLDRMVRKMVAESFGNEEYFDEHMEYSDYTLRAMKYESLKAVDQQGDHHVGLGAHTDRGYLTVLSQCERVNGLQVQTKDGNWIDVNPSPHAFVVMAGRALGVWTNGRVRPCYHQVIMSGNESRYSIAFAALPRGGYKVIPPGHLIDEDHPPPPEPYEYTAEVQKEFNFRDIMNTHVPR